MFSVGGINFADGVYHGSGINGAEVAILQSAENADNVINDFERAFMAGLDPNVVMHRVLDNRNLTEADFTDMDLARINRKVNAIYKTKNNEEWYR